MSIFDTDVAVRKTVEDFCEARANVVRLYSEAYQAMQIANSEMMKVYSYGIGMRDIPSDRDRERVIKEIDTKFWRLSFEHTGFMQLLDAEARNKFDKQNSEDPPPFTIENVRSTYVSLFQDAEMMFNRGVVNVFRRLSTDAYKTNDVFKIGPKVVMSYMVEANWTKGRRIRYGSGEDQINDIDRVFVVLDGKKHNPRALSNAMNAVFQNDEIFENDYFRAKAFKNGNLHMQFKREDLLEKVNLLIAKHYGGDAISKGSRK